jgi:hypothetical protein
LARNATAIPILPLEREKETFFQKARALDFHGVKKRGRPSEKVKIRLLDSFTATDFLAKPGLVPASSGENASRV